MKSYCIACSRKYSAEYYDANAETLTAAELARRTASGVKPKPKSPTPGGYRFHSLKIAVEYKPTEVRLAYAAFHVEYGKAPTERELLEYIQQWAKNAAIGHFRYKTERNNLDEILDY